MDESFARALGSLEGLSVGDALGQALFLAVPESLDARPLPAGPWPWTDDTHMALSVIEELQERGRIDADPLAARFARRFAGDPDRGYGTGAMVALASIARGARWRDVSPTLFQGQGSLGNGAAMRAAPIGAWFAGDPERAAREASIAALPTHTHPDGIAGAAAVAAAAAVVSGSDPPSGVGLLDDVLPHLLGGELRDRIELALTYRPHEAAAAAAALGTGLHVRASDTVPWCL
jgi:ADP-ribosylglycohydrolase